MTEPCTMPESTTGSMAISSCPSFGADWTSTFYRETGRALKLEAAYQFRLLGSGLPPFEEGELQAAIEFFEASLDALMGVSWDGRSRELLRLHERFESMAEAVCADPAVNVRWCQPFTFSLGRFYYLLEYKLEVFVDDPRFERTFSDPDWQSLDREPRLDALQRRLFGKGEESFQRLVTLSPDSHDALSALADWHWFYRKRDAATVLYRRACQLAPERFERASPLPEYPPLAFEPAFQAPPVPMVVNLSVTERGRPTDLAFFLTSCRRRSQPAGRGQACNAQYGVQARVCLLCRDSEQHLGAGSRLCRLISRCESPAARQLP